MRKLTFILTVLSALSLKAEARKLYIRTGVGYAAPTAGQTKDLGAFPLNGELTESPSGAISMNLKKASFSSGLNVNAALGYSFNNHIAVELSGFAVILPVRYSGTVNTFNSFSNIYTSLNLKKHAESPVFLIPSLVLQTGGKFNLYMRTGIVLPLKSDIKSENYVAGSNTANTRSTYHFKFNLGIAAATGVNFNIQKKIKVFAEANLISLSLYLKDVTTYNTEFKYAFKVNNSGGYNAVMSTYSYPFSAIGISAGLQFAL